MIEQTLLKLYDTLEEGGVYTQTFFSVDEAKKFYNDLLSLLSSYNDDSFDGVKICRRGNEVIVKRG